MSRFMADQWDKVRAQKRGGGVRAVPLQLDNAETRYGCEPADDRTPEQYFERRWALTLLDTVLQRLCADYEREGKGKLFAGLNSTLAGSRESQPYAQLGSSSGPFRRRGESGRAPPAQALSRFAAGRNRPNDAEGADVDEELHHLFAAVAGP